MSTQLDSKWIHALDILQQRIPGATDFNPDNIAGAAKRHGRHFAWRRLSNFDTRDDAEIWQDIKSQAFGVSGEEVIVVADVCFSADVGPQTVRYDDLDTWIGEFSNNYHDELFGGDAIFLFSAGVLLVHHEGLVAEIL